jgi:hypothetical protein
MRSRKIFKHLPTHRQTRMLRPATAHSTGALRFATISKWGLANRRHAHRWRSRKSSAVAVDGSNLRRIKRRNVEEKPDSNLRLGRFFLECEHIDEYFTGPECKLSADLRFAPEPVRAKTNSFSTSSASRTSPGPIILIGASVSPAFTVLITAS